MRLTQTQRCGHRESVHPAFPAFAQLLTRSASRRKCPYRPGCSEAAASGCYDACARAAARSYQQTKPAPKLCGFFCVDLADFCLPAVHTNALASPYDVRFITNVHRWMHPYTEKVIYRRDTCNQGSYLGLVASNAV
eukprot:366130-Chlamydomonas_euryale.AAC.74